MVAGDTQLGEETDECLHRQLVGCVLKQSVRGQWRDDTRDMYDRQ